jgi:hypothetical protein
VLLQRFDLDLSVSKTVPTYNVTATPAMVLPFKHCKCLGTKHAVLKVAIANPRHLILVGRQVNLANKISDAANLLFACCKPDLRVLALGRGV